MRGALLLGAVPTLVFGLACACGSGGPECGEGERDDWGTCVPIDCGEYPFGGFAGGNFVFVSASTYSDDEDQDGSEEDPYDTLAEGITAALTRDRSVVVVASGTYRESLLFDDRHDGLRIEGVCGPQVRIEGGELPTVMLDGSPETAVTVSSVQLANGLAGGVVVVGGRLVVSNIGVDGALGVGIAAFGPDSSLEVDDAFVTGTRAQEDYADGYGLAVADGATATVSGLSVGTSALAGVLVDGAGSSAVVTSAIRRREPGRPGRTSAVRDRGQQRRARDPHRHRARGLVGRRARGLRWQLGRRGPADRLLDLADRDRRGAVRERGRGPGGVDPRRGRFLTIRQAAVYGLAASGPRSTVTVDGGTIENSTPSSSRRPGSGSSRPTVRPSPHRTSGSPTTTCTAPWCPTPARRWC